MSRKILSMVLAAGLTTVFGGSVVANAESEMDAWDGDEDVELFSAVLTAVSCAQDLADTGDMTFVRTCSPTDAVREGYAIYDPLEEELYLLEEGTVRQFELEHGFGGSIDLFGIIIGTIDGIPVIQSDDYTITPKPSPSAFKGCL